MKTKTRTNLNGFARNGYGILIAFIFTSFFHYGQQTIYTENFANQENKGVAGVNNGAPIEDLTGVSWTIDYSAATLSASTDYFQVVSGLMLSLIHI